MFTMMLRLYYYRPISITSIRLKDEFPGLRDYEVSLLKFVEKITNGSRIVINETGTAVSFEPGQLTGGKFSHDCAPSKSVIYYLEVAAALALFCKEPLTLQLKGSTHDEFGNSVDIFRSVTVPLLQKLGVANDEDSQLSFKIVTRSYGESADGCVIFTCPIVKFIPPVDLTKEGLVKRVRGVFWSAKMNREFSVRFVESARSILNKCIEDVWIYTENVKNTTEPIYGASIMSETEYGFFKGINCLSKNPEEADKLGKRVAKQLLREIDAGGVSDESHQWLVCLFMAVSQDHKVSKAIVSSELSKNTIEFLRGIQDFLLVRFNLTRVTDPELTADDEEEAESHKGQIQLECIGINMTNTARKAL